MAKQKLERRKVYQRRFRLYDFEQVKMIERSRCAEGFHVDYEYDMMEECYVVKETLSLKPIIYENRPKTTNK
jgi:hypothetical protein